MVWYQAGATFKKAEFRLNQIPKRYHKFTKLWGPNSKRLIKHAPWDHKIKLKPRTTLKFFSVYKLIKTKNLTL